jgi:hypothetical protein
MMRSRHTVGFLFRRQDERKATALSWPPDLHEAAMRRTFCFSLLVLLPACDDAAAPTARAVVSTAAPSSALTAPAPGAASEPEIGDRITLEELARPERFAWPARFTCHLERTRGAEPLRLTGESVEDMSRQLVAVDVIADDRVGGFALESLEPQDGKLDSILYEPEAPAI